MTVDGREAFIQKLAVELSGAVPISPLSGIMFEALKRAGWEQSFSKAEGFQLKGGKGRARQMQEDKDIRRLFVSIIFKRLPKSHRAPGTKKSLRTALAIKDRLEELKLKRKPATSVRTIQGDIAFLEANGNFGI